MTQNYDVTYFFLFFFYACSGILPVEVIWKARKKDRALIHIYMNIFGGVNQPSLLKEEGLMANRRKPREKSLKFNKNVNKNKRDNHETESKHMLKKYLIRLLSSNFIKIRKILSQKEKTRVFHFYRYCPLFQNSCNTQFV